jgi:PAS domain S-box-containing protein
MASLIFDLATVLAEPAVARLIAEPGPWWLWSADATRLIAANTSGAKAMGASGASIAMERSYQTTHAFAGQIARISANLPADGTPRLERIRLYGRFGSESALAQARRLKAGDIGLVSVTLAGAHRGAARPAATAFVADIGAALALFDRNGLPIVASASASALANVRLDSLIGNGAADIYNTLDAAGVAHVDLVTGPLQLIVLPEADAILAVLPTVAKVEPDQGLRLVAPPVDDQAAEVAGAEPPAPADMAVSVGVAAPAPVEAALEAVSAVVEPVQPISPEPAPDDLAKEAIAVAAAETGQRLPAEVLTETNAETSSTEAGQQPTQAALAEPVVEPVCDAIAESDALLTAPQRFSWRLDADRRFHGVDQADLTAVAGLTFAEASDRYGMDPQGTFTAALDAARPFSGVPAIWPLGSTRRLSVTLAAFPSQRDGVVQGFAGFGLVGEELARPAVAAVVPTETPGDPALASADNNIVEAAALGADGDVTIEGDVKAEPGAAVPATVDAPEMTEAPALEADGDLVSGGDTKAPVDGSMTDDLVEDADVSAEPVGTGEVKVEVGTAAAPPAAPPAEVVQGVTTAETRAPHLTVHTNPPNVVALRTSAGIDPKRTAGLSPLERNAFREIAKVLGARPEQDDVPAADLPPPVQQGQVPPLVERAAPDAAEATVLAEASEAIEAASGSSETVAPVEPDSVAPTFVGDLTQKAVDTSEPLVPQTIATPAPVELVSGLDLEAPLLVEGGEPKAEIVQDEPKAVAEVTEADAAQPSDAADAGDTSPVVVASEGEAVEQAAAPDAKAVDETASAHESPTPEVASGEAPSAPVEQHAFIASGTPFGPLPSAFGAAPSIIPGAAPQAIVQPAAPAPAPVAEADTRALLDRLPLGLVVHRGNAVLFANRAVLDWTGFADAAALEAAGGVARLFAGGPSEGSDGSSLAITRADGAALPVEARLSKFPWAGEQAFLFTLRRVDAEETAEREAESATLSELRGRLDEVEQILDTATDGIVIVAPDGAVESMNRSAEALFGYESAEVKGRSITVLFAPESHRSAIDYCDGLMANGVASVLNDGRQIIGRVKQGGLIPLYMTMGRTGSDARPKLAAVFRDLTQWKKAEEDLVAAKRQAEQASSQKSDFLAKISHEIRTPLNAIIGFSEVMIEERFGAIGNERYRDYLKDIHSSGGHVLSLINDLLDLSKIEAGKLELSFTSVDLNDIVQSTVAIMQPQANRERVIIRSSLQGRLPNIVADARSLRQIVLNLLSNSVKFTPAGGQIIISTALSATGEAVLRVRDTGIGMTEIELKAAMEPFRQVATTSARDAKGTGLGLPLTKALVEANRASFGISSAPNHGTLVEVIFPPTRVLAE